MAEARDHSYFVYQDIDLKDNEIKNVTNISSDSLKTLSLQGGSSIELNSITNINADTTVTGEHRLVVTGASNLRSDVTIGTSTTDTSHKLFVAGVKIYWDTTSNSLIFEKVQTSNG